MVNVNSTHAPTVSRMQAFPCRLHAMLLRKMLEIGYVRTQQIRRKKSKKIKKNNSKKMPAVVIVVVAEMAAILTWLCDIIGSATLQARILFSLRLLSGDRRRGDLIA